MSVHSIPIEIWYRILNHLDWFTKCRLAQVNTFFQDVIQSMHSGQMLIACGISCEKVQSRYLIQPYHQLHDTSKPLRTQRYGLPKKEDCHHFYHFKFLLKEFINFNPFACLFSLSMYFDGESIGRRFFDLKYFTSLHTLELRYRTDSYGLIPIKNKDKHKLVRLRRLVLHGFKIHNLLIVCPNLGTLKCDLEQLDKIITSDILQLDSHGLEKFSIGNDPDPLVNVPNVKLYPTIRLRKVTFWINYLESNYLECKPYIPLAFNVDRVSYKFCPKIFQQGDYGQYRIISKLFCISSEIKLRYDLNQTNVTINGLRVTDKTEIDFSIFSYFEHIIMDSAQLSHLDFDRSCADRLRQKFVNELENNCKAERFLDQLFQYKKLSYLGLHWDTNQKLLDQIPDRFPFVYRIDLFFHYDETEPKRSIDLQFLMQMPNLKVLSLYGFHTKNPHILLELIAKPDPIHKLSLMIPQTNSMCQQLYDAMHEQALQNAFTKFTLELNNCGKAVEKNRLKNYQFVNY